MRQTKIYHVELKESIIIDGEPRKDFYFGSKAAIYSTLSPEQIGITYNYLRSKIHLNMKPYSNDKCYIRLGYLKRKMTTD